MRHTGLPRDQPQCAAVQEIGRQGVGFCSAASGTPCPPFFIRHLPISISHPLAR